MRTPILCAILLAVICFTTYHDVLNHPFMLDDHHFVSLSTIPSAYTGLGHFFTEQSSYHYAPIDHILNVSLFHAFKEPLPLYLINLILFYLNCLLFFMLIVLISGDYAIGLWTSILFCIHPMSAEIVLHISFNIILLTILFMQLSLISLWRYLDGRSGILLIASFLTCACALVCHETAILLPLYLSLLTFFKRNHFKEAFKISITFILLGLAYLTLWLSLVGHHSGIVGRLYMQSTPSC